MRKILTAIVALVSLLSTVPLVMPATSDVTASVEVQTWCSLQLSTSSISFGSMIPDQIVDGINVQDVTASQTAAANVDAVLDVFGNDWQTSSGFLVGQTHWSTTLTAYSSMNPLLSSATTPHVDSALLPTESDTVHFALQVPAHQAVASYTQTITFEVSCG